jgi:hypothetical protein
MRLLSSSTQLFFFFFFFISYLFSLSNLSIRSNTVDSNRLARH